MCYEHPAACRRQSLDCLAQCRKPLAEIKILSGGVLLDGDCFCGSVKLREKPCFESGSSHPVETEIDCRPNEKGFYTGFVFQPMVTGCKLYIKIMHDIVRQGLIDTFSTDSLNYLPV
ncbi:hypothetical protein L905_01815 [Agrobacterium sp. TS43]|nr:hypothetical protein L905_01815 [Agrobacterium sp. TS43]